MPVIIAFQQKEEGFGLYCVCMDHIELAIDKFVDEFEEAPDVINLTEATFTAWTPPERCDMCEKKPKLLVV